MRFDPNRINRNNKLGQGTFGTVFPYQKNSDDMRYVIKISHAIEFEKLGHALQEVFIGFNLNHPAILAYKDFHIERCRENTNFFRLYIKMPRMETSLKNFLLKRAKSGEGYLPKAMLLGSIKTLFSGLKFLAERKIAHRDLKPANTLIDFKGNLVIADLGEAKHSLEEDTIESKIRCRGTIPYMAPELLNPEEMNKMKKRELLKADVWSMGVTILDMCLLMQAETSSSDSMETRGQAISRDLEKVKKIYGKELTELLLDMLTFDPKKRKSIEEIYDDFIKKFENNGCGITVPAPQYFSQGFARNDSNQQHFHQNIYNLSFQTQHDYNMNIYNSFNSKRGEEDMMRDWNHYFHFKFDEKSVISLSQGSLDFNEKSERFPSMIQQFSKTIEEHKIKISNFNIEFSKFLSFTNQNLNQLLIELNKSLTDLKELSLNFSDCPSITNQGLESLKNYFEKNQGLEKLSLSFDGNPNFNDESLDYLSSNIATYLRNLKSLNLSFENCPISLGGVRRLDKRLGKLKKLKDLTLNFKGCSTEIGTSTRTHLELTLKGSIENLHFIFEC